MEGLLNTNSETYLNLKFIQMKRQPSIQFHSGPNLMDNLSDVLLSDSDVIIFKSYCIRHIKWILLTLILLDLLFDSIFSLFPTERT